jgi:hypothetical protein
MKRVALALCLFALPSLALADGDYRWELTPHLSYHFGGSLEGDTADLPVAYDLDVDNGLAYGVTFDIPLSSNLQLELLLNHQGTELTADSGLFTPDVDAFDVDITYAHVGLLAQFGRREVTPYFVGSLGVTRLDADLAGVGADDRFSASIGGGVKVFILPFLGLRFEGRAFWTDVDQYETYCDDRFDHRDCYDYTDFLSQGELTAGLIFAW